MSEKLTPKNRNILSVGLASLALAAGVASTETSPANATPFPGAKKVLAKGDNIHQIRMLSPDPHKNTAFRLKPKSQKDTEDLAVVFEQNYSDKMISVMGEPEVGDSVGYIIESAIGKTAVKIVFFKTKTGKIDLVSPHAIPIKTKQEMFEYVDPANASEGYIATLTPQTNTHGTIVNFDHAR